MSINIKFAALYLLALSLWSVSSLRAQKITRWTAPVVMEVGKSLENPFAGGLNTPQFSTIFLNADTLSDLFIFDRSGYKILPFLADDQVLGKYKYAPEFEAVFPKLVEWALLRDFNGDSIPDIFTFSDTGVPGIDVYRGQRTEAGLTYQRVSLDNPVGVLGYPTSSGTITNIYVAAFDIPAIGDIDQDGDLDILTFDSGGTKLHYYRNMSLEYDLGLDSLIFILEDKCWGKVVESFNTNEVTLSPDSLVCPSSNQNARVHGGSTVMTFDASSDGDTDVLLGDFSYETMLFLENGGSTEIAWITNQTSDFPTAEEKISVPYFPVSFLLDINHDGIEDLLVSPNQKDARENVTLSWYYAGTIDQDLGHEFNLVTTSFLNDEMLDFGTDATPLFFDYDADGLSDLIIGSRFNKEYQVDHPSQLFLLKNVGSSAAPKFEMVDRDWLDLSRTLDEIDALSPTTADIDGDNDLDLVIGNKRGKLIFVENIGISNGPFELGSIVYPWFDIDVGFSSVPALYDLDADGDLDLLIGEEKGNINFFRNMGSREIPHFNPDVDMEENNEEFGLIDARQNNAVFGMAAPEIIHSLDTTFLLVGTAFGNILIYDISQVQPEDQLAQIPNHPLGQLSEGNRSKLAFEDLDTDGYLDMVLGTSRGGLTLFKTGFRSGEVVSTHDHHISNSLWITPNPAQDYITIDLAVSPMQHINIYSAMGQIVQSWTGDSRKIRMDVSDLAPGVYFTLVSASGRTGMKTWVKM